MVSLLKTLWSRVLHHFVTHAKNKPQILKSNICQLTSFMSLVSVLDRCRRRNSLSLYLLVMNDFLSSDTQSWDILASSIISNSKKSLALAFPIAFISCRNKQNMLKHCSAKIKHLSVKFNKYRAQDNSSSRYQIIL